MTDEELAEIAARCAGAWPGPWVPYVEGRDHWGGDSFIKLGSDTESAEDLYLQFYDLPIPTADYDFIARARQDVPALLAEVHRLRGILNQEPASR